MKLLTYVLMLFVFYPSMSAQKLKFVTKEYTYGELLKEEYYVLKKNKFIKQGIYTSYFRNGEVKESGEFWNNRRNDIWEEYNKHGDTISLKEFNKGELVKGSKVGVWKEFDSNNVPYFYDYNKKEIVMPQIPLNINYPSRARESKISGIVEFKIILDENCELSKMIIVKSLGEEFTAEAKRGIDEYLEKIKMYKYNCANLEEDFEISFTLD